MELKTFYSPPDFYILRTHTHADFSGGQIRLSQLSAEPIIMG